MQRICCRFGGLGDAWRPLREALHALAEGDEDLLLRVAPEVREPARLVYAYFTGPDPFTWPPA